MKKVKSDGDNDDIPKKTILTSPFIKFIIRADKFIKEFDNFRLDINNIVIDSLINDRKKNG